MDEETGVVPLEEIQNETNMKKEESLTEGSNDETKIESEARKETISSGSCGRKALDFLKTKHPWVVLTIALFSVSSAASALKMIPVS